MLLAAALVRAEEGDLDRAITFIDMAIGVTATTGNVPGFFLRASLNLRRGKAADALIDLQRGLAVWPGYVPGYRQRAEAHLAMGHIDAAIADYDRVINRFPNLGVLYAERGFAHARLSHRDRTHEDFQRAAGLDPRNADLLNHIAWTLATGRHAGVRDGDWAIELVEQALALRDDDPAYVDTLAAALAESGHFELAVATQQRAIALERDSGRAVFVPAMEERLNAYQLRMPWRE
jgi:tetratricopeptide (TPR) repeat protein